MHATGFYFDKILVLALAWYAADLVWRERQHGVDEMMDVLPVGDTPRLLAKTLMLLAVVIAFWVLAIAMDIGYQLAHGFTRIEPALYLIDAFGYKAPYHLWLAIQIVVRNRYVAIGIFLLVYVSGVMLDALKLYHPLYRFAEVNFFWYSPMNGYCHFQSGHYWMLLYWTLGAAIIGLFAWSVYSGGTAPPARRVLFQHKLGKPRARLVAGVLIGAFGAAGAYINYQTAVVNPWPAPDNESRKAEVEKAYGEAWRGKPQPRVVGINSDYRFYPRQRRLEMRGEYVLQNRGSTPIKDVLILFEPDLTGTSVGFERTAALTDKNVRLGIEHWTLAQDLAPGERVNMHFTAVSAPLGGFKAHAKNEGVPEVGPVEVIDNGTSLLNLQLMPAVGYTDRVEHKPQWQRRKYGLPLEWPAPRGEEALRQAHDTLHLDWVESLDAIVTTDADQTPLHVGKVISDTITADNRRRIHYHLDGPVRGWSEVMSARYSHQRFTRPEIPPLDIYYSPGQTYHLDEMARHYLDAMAYFKDRYGPAPFDSFRLAQQSLHYDGMGNRAGLGFASEILGWKAYPVASQGIVVAKMAAHMMGMSWFGDQIIPANLPGAKILHACLPYWSAGLYLQQWQGPKLSREYRRQEIGEIFRARHALDDEEAGFLQEQKNSTLIRRKGAILMAYLAELVGSRTLEEAFKSFLDTWRYRAAPFATGQDFYRHLAARIPAQYHAQLDDIFARVTRWDVRAVKASATPAANGKWQIEVVIETRKYHAEGLGGEREVAFATPVAVALSNDREFADGAIQRQRIYPASGRSSLVLETDGKPAYFGIDPDFLLPDTNLHNQIIPINYADD